MKMLQYKFVEFIPDKVEEGILYISIEYCTAIHKCVCGCGNEVVTPLSPTDWKLTFNGKAVSLYPSIGNWNFDCQSHYWVKNNHIEFAEPWTKNEVQAGRHDDYESKKEYFEEAEAPKNEVASSKELRFSFWKKLLTFKAFK